MPNVSDVTGALLAWGAFLVFLFRSFNVSALLFVSINAQLFLRFSIQAHSGSKEAPVTTRNCRAQPDSHGHDGEVAAASNHRDRINTVPRPPSATQYERLPTSNRRRRSFDGDKGSISAKQQPSVGYGTIMEMYQEIIASDAETIQVQQATIQSHLEIIRSQREMIQKLQQLVEAQDAWIEEHVEEPST